MSCPSSFSSAAIETTTHDGRPPEEVARFDQNDVFDFDYSSSGQFAVTRGVWKWDVVLISDLNVGADLSQDSQLRALSEETQPERLIEQIEARENN